MRRKGNLCRSDSPEHFVNHVPGRPSGRWCPSWRRRPFFDCIKPVGSKPSGPISQGQQPPVQ
jgi:hypothetical protein